MSPTARRSTSPSKSRAGVAIFNRGADGTLTQHDRPRGRCVSANGASGADGRTLHRRQRRRSTSAYVVAISPDGRAVYAGGADGVASFARDSTTGGLVQTGCNGPVAGCAPVARGRVVACSTWRSTPDGGEVIAAAHGSESVVSFHRDAATGRAERHRPAPAAA